MQTLAFPKVWFTVAQFILVYFRVIKMDCCSLCYI
jgi:hypothetical protein